MTVSSQHDTVQHFRRLERTAFLIVRHPNFPGKAETVRSCRDDIEQRFRQELITKERGTRLLAHPQR